MPNCFGCNSKIDRYDDFIDCGSCNNSFHIKCENLSLTDFNGIQRDNKRFCCSKCKSFSQKTDFKKLTAQLEENSAFLRRLNDEFISRFNAIQSSIDAIAAIKNECVSLRAENTLLKKKLAFIECKIDKLEPMNVDSIEIFGVPEIDNENLIDTVKNICNAGLKLNVQDNNIKKCFRVKKRNSNSMVNNTNKHSHPKIIVVCDSQVTRDQIIKKRQEKKTLVSNEIGFNVSSKINIFGTMSPYKKRLLYLAYEAKRNGKFFNVWVSDGNVLGKREDGGKITRINTIYDLNLNDE